MIGRDAELAALQDAFERLFTERQFAAVTVVAEAGVGKSRLLYEFEPGPRRGPSSSISFRGRATPQTQASPTACCATSSRWRLQIADDDTLQAARQKIEHGIAPLFVQDDGEDLAEGHAHLLGHLIGLDFSDSPHIRGIRDDPRQIRNRAFHAAAQTFRRLSASDGKPVVLQLEDLHWADDATLDFLSHLAEVNRDVPHADPGAWHGRPCSSAGRLAGHCNTDTSASTSARWTRLRAACSPTNCCRSCRRSRRPCAN